MSKAKDRSGRGSGQRPPPSAKPTPVPAPTAIHLADAIVARAKRKTPVPLVAGLHDGTGPYKTKLPHSQIQGWVAAGVTSNADLAMLCRVEAGVETTRQAILNWRKTFDDGYTVRKRSPHKDALIPWKVAIKENSDRLYRVLLTEARIREQMDNPNARPPAAPDLARHHFVMDEMSDAGLGQGPGGGGVVIYYDREVGFCYRARRVGVDTDLIFDPRLHNDGTPNDDKSTWQ